jgi:hypothetical protein
VLLAHSSGGSLMLARSQPQLQAVSCRWNGEVKAGDKIERAHHRHVRSCRLEGGPVALAPGGPAALKVVIVGDSFMLHQIRCAERADCLWCPESVGRYCCKGSPACPRSPAWLHWLVLPLHDTLTMTAAEQQGAAAHLCETGPLH